MAVRPASISDAGYLGGDLQAEVGGHVVDRPVLALGEQGDRPADPRCRYARARGPGVRWPRDE